MRQELTTDVTGLDWIFIVQSSLCLYDLYMVYGLFKTFSSPLQPLQAPGFSFKIVFFHPQLVQQGFFGVFLVWFS